MIKKYGEKVSNSIKLQSVNIELGGSLDAKFSEISKVLCLILVTKNFKISQKFYAVL